MYAGLSITGGGASDPLRYVQLPKDSAEELQIAIWLFHADIMRRADGGEFLAKCALPGIRNVGEMINSQNDFFFNLCHNDYSRLVCGRIGREIIEEAIVMHAEEFRAGGNASKRAIAAAEKLVRDYDAAEWKDTPAKD